MIPLLFRVVASLLLLLPTILTYSAPKPPFRFIENRNQWSRQILFAGAMHGGNVILEQGKIRYLLKGSFPSDAHHAKDPGVPPEESYAAGNHIVDVNFVNANPDVVLTPLSQSPEYYNFFLGKNSERWVGNVKGYEGVIYSSLYNGIDLKIYTTARGLKYDLIVAPGADPNQIAFLYQGQDDIYLNSGSLHVVTSLGEIIERRPFTYQVIEGKQVEVVSEFKLVDDQVTFSFPAGFNNCYPLIIDPLLIFSTFSGSDADNWGSSATPGEHGTLYSTGVTNHFAGPNFSGTYPATPGAFQTEYGGNYDIGLLKYDSTGAQLLYASYLGGAASECPHSLVMNNQSELLILGTTGSSDFPITSGSFDPTFNAGTPTGVMGAIVYPNGSDLIVSKVSSDGSQLIASTFLGGTLNDGINFIGAGLNKNYGDELRGDIIVDATDNVYISSLTASTDFPIRNGLAEGFHGGITDAIVLKLKDDLSDLEWASFLGGLEADASHTIQFDPDENIIIGGGTMSGDFKITPGVYSEQLKGDADGWIAKISSDGAMILASTFTGTIEYDQVYFIDVDKDGDIYAYGQTAGAFPVTPGSASNPGSGQFVQRFSTDLQALRFSTVFGAGRGFPDISPTAFLVNDCGNLFMAGWGGIINTSRGFWQSGTQGLFTTADALQRTTTNNDFYFLVMKSDGTRFLYATFLGGPNAPIHVDGGTSRFDKKGIVYHAVCAGCGGPFSDFPTTEGAWSNENESLNCNNAAFKLDLASLRALARTNNTQFTQPGIQSICIPDSVVFENLSLGGQLYEWDFGDGKTLSTASNKFVKHYYEEPGVYTVKLRAIDIGTCQGVDSTTLLVKIFHGAVEIGDDDNLCEGSAYKLQASGGSFYEWTTSDGTFVSSSDSPTVSPTATTQYNVRVTDQNGCIEEDSVMITVIPKIDPEFDFTRGDACFSDSKIEATNLTDNIGGSDYMFFDFGDGHQDEGDKVFHVYEKPGTYALKLVGVREECVFEKTLNVPFGSVYVPNVITPTATASKNDAFRIMYGSKTGEGLTSADAGFLTSVIIYNRWGTKVYENADYKSDWHADDVAAGIYYFEVSVAEHPSCKGWLQVIK